MDDPLDSDEHGSNEFDDSCLIVGTINILGTDWFRKTMIWELVSFDESPIQTID